MSTCVLSLAQVLQNSSTKAHRPRRLGSKDAKGKPVFKAVPEGRQSANKRQQAGKQGAASGERVVDVGGRVQAGVATVLSGLCRCRK